MKSTVVPRAFLHGVLEHFEFVDPNVSYHFSQQLQNEWPKRWESFPKKLMVAYGKFHAITIMMRVYESLAAKLYDDVFVDALTVDTYSSTLRREKVGKQLRTRENFSECWTSNFIA